MWCTMKKDDHEEVMYLFQELTFMLKDVKAAIYGTLNGSPFWLSLSDYRACLRSGGGGEIMMIFQIVYIYSYI